VLIGCAQAAAANLTGTVQIAGQPVAGSTVTLYAAGTGAPLGLRIAAGNTPNLVDLETGLRLYRDLRCCGPGDNSAHRHSAQRIN
jgi:hypothetical protein